MDQDAKVERLLEMLRRAAEQLPEEESENASGRNWNQSWK